MLSVLANMSTHIYTKMEKYTAISILTPANIPTYTFSKTGR